MDRLSLELANIAVGNDPGEAGLEITLLGPDIRFSAETRFAIAGGRCEATLSGKSLPMYESIAAGAGEILSLGPVLSGMRCYLAVAGGFALDPVMGSLSTSIQGGFGGFQGRRLMAGDRLGLRGRPQVSGARPVPLRMRPEFSVRYRLRVTLSHEKDRFTDEAMETFFSSSWSVSPKSDRMGIRLAGPALAHSRGADIISSGVLTGTIQVPGQGNPIILAADRQTTGGYTRLAQVVAADLSILGRLKPGDSVEFVAIGQDEARRLYRESRVAPAGLAARSPDSPLSPDSARSGVPEAGERRFRVEVNGRSYVVGVSEV
jgi:biotin-dependent carboxylase-like uncharacterized protein